MPAGSSVLVVEDDADIRAALCSILAEEGYRVASACEGQDALRQLRAGLRPDVILLDLMMPVMSGGEFRVAQLRDPELAQVPVVILTADGRFQEQARALGAAAAFAKPFELAALLGTIERIAGPTRPGARASA
jgi:two-component system response regulator MprA